MKKAVFLLFLFSGLPVFAGAEAVPNGIDQAIRSSGIPPAGLSLVLWRVGDDSPMVDLNGGIARNPASLMKLVTSWAALSLLGPAHTWRTEIRADAPPDKNGVVGNLYLTGQGNPYWTLEDFENLLRTLRARGVTRVTGNLVLEQNRFPTEPGSFQDGQPWRAYNVIPDSMMLGFRSITWNLQVEGDQIMVLPNFQMPGVILVNHLKVAEGECPLGWKGLIEKNIFDDGRNTTITLSGSFSRGCEGKTLAFSVLDNERFVQGAFEKIWSELGGEFHGQVTRGEIPAGLTALAAQDSPALSQVLVAMNKESNNPMARSLYLDLGCNGQTQCLATDSEKRVKEALVQAGLNLGQLSLENGSGLSRQARISARDLAQLLLSVKRTLWEPEFKASLPLYGLDGTLKHQGGDEVWAGRFRLKGGTLDGVRGLAGYGLSQTGREFVLVMMVNHEQSTHFDGVARAVLDWVYLQH